jgi:hypothetical protein
VLDTLLSPDSDRFRLTSAFLTARHSKLLSRDTTEWAWCLSYSPLKLIKLYLLVTYT